MKQELDIFITYLKNQKIIKNNIIKDHYLSGNNTEVYPITVWRNNITIKLEGNYTNKYFEKLFERVKNNFSFIKTCYFCKNDGSCPQELVFYYELIED